MAPGSPQPESPAHDAGRAEARGGGRAPVKFLYASGAQPLPGYTIKRGVGRGGFGEVYFAVSDAGKEVALKLIRRNLDVELRGVRHCLNLKHPNLIALYDIRSDDQDDQWVVMEYVQGESLEDVLARSPQGLPPEDVNWWMRGIAAGVSHLHDNGIVHRDLKPGNIFLDRSMGGADSGAGTIKLGDYGLSKFISCSRRSGQTESVGTVHYMAPEIAGGRYGREIDTYALGIILYELLTGHVPFEGESVGEVLMKHLTAEPELSKLAEPYREIVRRALTKDPELRIQSVGELIAMLPGGAVDASATAARRPNHDAPRPTFREAPEVEPEPIWNAVASGLSGARSRWVHNYSHPLVRGLIVFAAVMLAVVSMEVWIPVAVFLSIMYGMYFLVWAWIIRPNVDPSLSGGAGARRSPNQHAPTAIYRTGGPRPKRRHWREKALTQLTDKPWRDHAGELLTAMLVSGGVCSLLAIAAGAISGPQNQTAVTLWFAGVATVGSWGVLIVNRLTEGRTEDQTPMRAMMLGVGAVVGVTAFLLSDALLTGVPKWSDAAPRMGESFVYGALKIPGPDFDPGSGLMAIDLTMAVGYFALLFLTLRWWKLAEWTREGRLSLGRVTACVGLAWLLGLFWWFPQPAGVMAAGIVAISTQLSSPWLRPSKRIELAKESY
ncbi:Serine/threonine-protein kinase PrkC [Pirellulimonas nuda]|uniref:Serine/threonine-protein kinase PrkC n=1 Tax=Pirellulimonas nuda TaxID=2528009 RepID=A0A518DI68_9BACT|nr:serine/threonine-protein kinase [Pirellulimonas nuda]QDU91181.1 Serine/threonine-protein kinase PrkC [Pirellulimonas nuda]